MALSNPPAFEHLRDSDLRARLVTLRAGVASLLQIDLLLHFTDHGVAHSDELTLAIDQIIRHAQANSTSRLVDSELFILYASCYLHDAGMHYEAISNFNTIIKRPETRGWDALNGDVRKKYIRDLHNELSAELVMRSVRTEHPPVGFSLTEADAPHLIARLAEAHTLDPSSAQYQDLTQEAQAIRMPLLSALLRIADILDESQRRANPVSRRSLALSAEAASHWWRHYYTRAIQFDQATRQIIVHFEFPTERREEYASYIPQRQMPWIEKELEQQLPILIRHNYAWSPHSRIDGGPYSSVEQMPPEIERVLIKETASDRAATAEIARSSVLTALSEARPSLLRDLEEMEKLKTSKDSVAYVRAAVALSDRLLELGANNAAWHVLWARFSHEGSALDSLERLQTGIKLAKLQVDDGHDDLALDVVRPLLPVAESLKADDPIKLDFWRLWIEVLIAQCAYPDAIGAIQRGFQIVSNERSHEEFKALLAEIHLLQVEMEPAMSACKSEEWDTNVK